MPPHSGRLAVARILGLAAVLALGAGCSLVRNKIGSSLAETGTTFTSDNDPQLVREAIPFGLKLYESILESVPKNRDLLVATCSMYTEYAYAYLDGDAAVLGEAHHDEAGALKDRALNLFLRGRGYCLRAMDTRFPKRREALLRDPALVVAKAGKKDIPLLYWTAASWGAAISARPDDYGIDFPVVRGLMERALALDESALHGSLHETMITIDSLGDALGGSEARAREHFRRAVELQGGTSPGPYVALATGLSIKNKDRIEFETLLNEALAIDPKADPDRQLVTILMKQRARALLDRVDEIFPKGNGAGRR